MKGGNVITVWITKYVFSEGILEREVEVCDSDLWPKGMVKEVNRRNPNLIAQYFHGKDWHTTREKAVARAEEMRKKKIASLEKQLAKLKKMMF